MLPQDSEESVYSKQDVQPIQQPSSFLLMQQKKKLKKFLFMNAKNEES